MSQREKRDFAEYTGVFDAYETRMRETFDFRPNPTRSRYPRCPRTIVGKVCQRHNGKCICQDVDYRMHIFDHVHTWVDFYGNYILTAEPYNWIRGTTLAALIADLDEIGVGLKITSGVWTETTTLLVMADKSLINL